MLFRAFPLVVRSLVLSTTGASISAADSAEYAGYLYLAYGGSQHELSIRDGRGLVLTKKRTEIRSGNRWLWM
jgi:hypothetical protein